MKTKKASIYRSMQSGGQMNPYNTLNANTLAPEAPKMNFNYAMMGAKLGTQFGGPGVGTAIGAGLGLGADVLMHNKLDKQYDKDVVTFREGQKKMEDQFNVYTQPGGYMQGNTNMSDGGHYDLNDPKSRSLYYSIENNNNYKDGGWIKKAINPAHKGYCTPMTKSTCTGHRRALAMTFKKHHGFHKGHEMGGEVEEQQENFSQGGKYGVISGNGNSKADDKNMSLKDGSYVIPNDTNSTTDPKIKFAQSLLDYLGHDGDKKINASEGGNGNVNISSKELVLNPKQSKQFDSLLGGPANKEKLLTPNSEYNQHFANGGNTDDIDWGEIDKGVDLKGGDPDATLLAPSQATLDQNRAMTMGENYKNENVNPDEIDTKAPSFYNAKTEMTNQEQQDPNNFSMTDDLWSKMNNYKEPPTTTTNSPTINPPSVDKQSQNTPTDAMFSEFEKTNKNLLAANEIVAGGEALYNLAQKYQGAPKPKQYNPQIYSKDYNGLENEFKSNIQRSDATALYNLRNSGAGNLSVGSSQIQANDLTAKNKASAEIYDLREQDKVRTTGEKNQASLFNLQSENQWASQEAQNKSNFRLQKGQAISANLSAGLQAYGNYSNSKLGALAYKSGMDQNTYMNNIYTKLSRGEKLSSEEQGIIDSLGYGNKSTTKITPTV